MRQATDFLIQAQLYECVVYITCYSQSWSIAKGTLIEDSLVEHYRVQH